MKGISILGSTGSIGCNTLKVVEELDDLRVVAMSAGRNIERFAEQIVRHRPAIVSCRDEESCERLERELHRLGAVPPTVLPGEAGMTAAATADGADVVVSAAVGAAGLLPTLRAVETGRRVCLANKEALVVAGEVITAAAASSGAEIIPIDSEHSAIHQCLRGEDRGQVKRLVLTASGGPFLDRSIEEMRRATPAEALAHPNWSMGDKISIDSATLMNKGLEVIEAHWLFGFGPESISVIIHPQSIIHSMIETVDGSYIAQLGPTDMRHAIRYAITYPERRSCLAADGFDPTQMGPLTFDEPDRGRFPCLQLAFDALGAGGTVPAALNAANEVAVDAFLAGRIRFTDIAEVNRAVMNEHSPMDAGDLANVLEADRVSRRQAASMVAGSAAAEAGMPV